jgi:hypothetical protein
MAEHIYERDGDVFIPTVWAGSPWSADSQHGAPVAGLFTRSAEACAAESGLQLARLSVDLFRPVPKQPLRLTTRWLRRGRRLGLVESALSLGDEEVSRGTALLLAPRPELVSGWAPDATPPPPPPESARELEFMPNVFSASAPPGFHFSLKVRTARDAHGPIAWLTTPLDLVAGEPTSPQVRFGALSDMTFAMAGRLALRVRPVEGAPVQMRFINADITIYRERTPQGDWLGMRPATVSERAGIGIVEVVQFDSAGRIGRSLQALVANASG